MSISQGLLDQAAALAGQIYDQGFSDGVASVPVVVPPSDDVAKAVNEERARISAALLEVLSQEEADLEAKVNAVINPA